MILFQQFILKLTTITLDEIVQVLKNTFAMSLHKVGGVLVEATDNLIMSAFVGLSAVGIYSNYTLIANNIRSCLIIVFNSFTASVGNLAAVENRERVHETFRIFSQVDVLLPYMNYLILLYVFGLVKIIYLERPLLQL